jgi:hypothetical protein
LKRLAAILLVALAGCVTLPEARPSRVHHVVLCWLKDPGNTSQRRQIIDVSRTFREIPGVVDVRVGEAVESDRAIVDDSFDVAIFLSFPDRQSLNGYLVHPAHQEAKRAILLPIVSKIVVYDFEEPVQSSHVESD